MSTQNSQPIIDNETKEEVIEAKKQEQDQSAPLTQSTAFDQIPIGSGNKFNFSEFPTEEQINKPRPKKTSKKPPKQQQPTPLPSKDQQLPNDSQPSTTNQVPVGTVTTAFDEKPIGNSKFNVSEFPEGEQQAPVQKEYSMTQKLASKAVKLRFSGMQDLIKLLEQDANHPDIGDIQLKNLLKQTTPANLQKSLQVYQLWIKNNKPFGEQEIKLMIQNGYINGKANCKKISSQLLDLIYQTNPAEVQMIILLGFKAKVPKLLAGYIAALNQLLSIYGVKKMKFLKPYFPELVRIITNQKAAAVRNEAMNSLKEAYKWLGKAVVDPLINNLKEAVKKQLDVFWESYDQTIVMTAPKDTAQQQKGGAPKKKIDAYQISDAVDIFKKFNQKWADSVLKAQKWNQKTKLMEQFVSAANVPKLACTEYRHITQVMKRLINDSNFNVVLWDLKMMAALSKGLRRNFYPTAKNMFSNVIGKFRDKKTQMIDETFNTLTDFLYCLSLEDVVDDVKEGLNDKAPNMKVNIVNWIGKFVEGKINEKGDLSDKTKEALKSLFSIFEKLLNDGVADVRNCMVKNVSKLKILIGDDFVAPLESKMNKNLASKLDNTTEQTKSKIKEKSKEKDKDLSKSHIKVPPSKSDKKDSNLSKTVKIQSEKKIDKQPQLVVQSFDSPSFEESCQILVSQGLPQQQVANITASGAKQRLAVMSYIKQNQIQNLDAILRVYKKMFKDWKQSNLLMNKQLVGYIYDNSQRMGKNQSYIAIPYIIEKIGQNKFNEGLNGAIDNICKNIDGNFIIGNIIKYIKQSECKKPKINGDVCLLIGRIIDNVSINNIPVKQTIEFGRDCYGLPISKKNATELLTKLYANLGEQIKIFLDQDTTKAMQVIFKNTKLLSEAQKKPRISICKQLIQQNKKINLAQMKPKIDISNQIIKMIPKMNDMSNWQNRKQAAQNIINIINENYSRVTINCLNELIPILKIRINDQNKNLIKYYVNLTGLIFTVISQKQAKNNYKIFVYTLVDGLCDKNQGNRKQIIQSLNKIGDVVNKQNIISILGNYLQGDKQSRLEIINFILQNQSFINKTQLKDFPKGLVTCLCDKNKDIRNNAEKLFQKVYEKIGIDIFRNLAKNQRPAFTKDLNALFDKFQKNQKIYNSSILSKGVSPSKINVDRSKAAPPSAKQKSVQKSHSQNQTQKSFIIDNNQDKSYYEESKSKLYAFGDQIFAPVKVLAGEKVQRQQMDQRNPWKWDYIEEQQQDYLRQQLSILIRTDLSKNMQSFQHKRVISAVVQLIKACKDLTYQNQIRQIHDLLIKWVFLRLWGGNPVLMSVFEIISPILSILQRKKLALSEIEIDLIIGVVREYFISSSMNDYRLSESLYKTIQYLVILSSGEKILKKLLFQFKIELTELHKHLNQKTTNFYRDGLKKLIKIQLMDFIRSQDVLEEIAKIKELKNDQEFIDMLYQIFQENMLSCFGFRKNNAQALPHKSPNNRSLQRKDHSYSKISQDMSRSKITDNSVSNAPRVPHRTNDNQERNYVRRNDELQLNLEAYNSPHPSSPLGKHLCKLYPPNEQNINFFLSLFQESGQKISNELQMHAKIIFGSILQSVIDVLKYRDEYCPQKIANQINLLQQSIKCKYIIKNIGNNLLYNATKFALLQLVNEDENRIQIHESLKNRGYEYKIQNFIKIINSVMLRLLQNVNSQQIINILLRLLIQSLNENNTTQKTIYLIIKCIIRVSQKYCNDLINENIQQFFYLINQYFTISNLEYNLQEFTINDPQKPKPQHNFIQTIKLILNKLIKQFNSDIWIIYDKSSKMFKYTDNHIANFIISLNVKHPRPSNINRPQHSQLKKINDCLAKSRTFQEGINLLKQYINDHPDFSPTDYFTSLNYDQNFIVMVMNRLQGKSRLTPAGREDKSRNSKKSIINQTNQIQDKIKKLREKFEQKKQPQETPPMPAKNIPNRNQDDRKEDRAHQIKRRIQEMKNKINKQR